MTTKLEQFISTQQAYCIHHGNHSDWIPVNGRKAVECKPCLRKRTREWNYRNPLYQDNWRYSKKGCICRILSQAKSRAKRNGLKFELSADWFNRKIDEQNNKCLYSGVELSFDIELNKNKRYYLPSIDQKIPGLGYTVENSVLVCTIVNIMKQDFPLELFREICGEVFKKWQN